MSRALTEAILSSETRLTPRLGWLVTAGHWFGLDEGIVISAAWLGLLVAAGCFLLVGLFCRPAAIVAWFLYLCSVKSGELFSYGVDNFTTIGLFYVLIAPLPDPVRPRSEASEEAHDRSGAHGFPSSRIATSPLCRLFFWRHRQVFWRRLVERQ